MNNRGRASPARKTPLLYGWREPVMNVVNGAALRYRPQGAQSAAAASPARQTGGWLEMPGCLYGCCCRCRSLPCEHAGLTGWQAQATAGTAVEAGEAVRFDAALFDRAAGVACAPAGGFAIAEGGYYLVSWSVNLALPEARTARFGLFLGGDAAAAADAWMQRGALSGTALLAIPAGAVLSLRNTGGDAAAFDQECVVRANIVLARVQ